MGTGVGVVLAGGLYIVLCITGIIHCVFMPCMNIILHRDYTLIIQVIKKVTTTRAALLGE